jgi:hypothetical protein
MVECVSGIRYELRGEGSEQGLIDELAGSHPRIGIAGLLRRRGRLARPGRVPASAAIEGFRWRTPDGWSQRWWPQGIELLDERDDLLLVSWFAQPRRGVNQGARITVVDRRDRRRPRYHHVLLVEAWRDGSVIRMRPVIIHAGGLAVVGNRLYVAATYGGLRRFDLVDILRVKGRAPFGYRCVLPGTSASWAAMATAGCASHSCRSSANPRAAASISLWASSDPTETAGGSAGCGSTRLISARRHPTRSR